MTLKQLFYQTLIYEGWAVSVGRGWTEQDLINVEVDEEVGGWVQGWGTRRNDCRASRVVPSGELSAALTPSFPYTRVPHHGSLQGPVSLCHPGVPVPPARLPPVRWVLSVFFWFFMFLFLPDICCCFFYYATIFLFSYLIFLQLIFLFLFSFFFFILSFSSSFFFLLLAFPIPRIVFLFLFNLFFSIFVPVLSII